MATLLVSQRNYDDHRTPSGHPERADRLRAIEQALSQERFPKLLRKDAPFGDLTLAELVHSPGYLQALSQARPAEGIGQIDEDTFISSTSLDAAGTALGAGLAALDAVALGEAENAFCAVRPPGHHAERETPMGFCLINTIAVVAREAQRKYGAERVAIVDFDVHHGNGTQDIFYDDPTVMYASTHQMPLFPGTGAASETGAGNIVNAPLAANTGRDAMMEAYDGTILPRLRAFLALLPSVRRAAFEFRHGSWLDDEVFQLLRDNNVALCIAEAEDDLDVPFVTTADWGYLRLRLPEYSDSDLRGWLERVRAQSWREAFVFFKHEDEGKGPQLAARLIELNS